MKRLKSLVPILVIAVLVLATVPAFAGDFAVKNWRVFNGNPGTAFFWDINKAQETSDSLSFPIQKFDTKSTGSFAIYLLANYNVDLTNKTIAATGLSWTQGVYETRGACSGAHVRFWFQDVASGPYDVNDYWWSTGVNSLDLNGATSGSLEVSLADRTLWTNMAGLSATDTTTENYYAPWNDSTARNTPYDGFTKAMKDVKQMGLSFGNACSYASGVALVGGTGTFAVNSFTVQ